MRPAPSDGASLSVHYTMKSVIHLERYTARLPTLAFAKVAQGVHSMTHYAAVSNVQNATLTSYDVPRIESLVKFAASSFGKAGF